MSYIENFNFFVLLILLPIIFMSFFMKRICDVLNLYDAPNSTRKIHKKPNANQRELASELNVSLGKLNYVLKELKKKGLVKINNFKNNPNKSGYLYLLTPKGISLKTKLTINFMKKKMKEYDDLKSEIEESKRCD